MQQVGRERTCDNLQAWNMFRCLVLSWSIAVLLGCIFGCKAKWRRFKLEALLHILRIHFHQWALQGQNNFRPGKPRLRQLPCPWSHRSAVVVPVWFKMVHLTFFFFFECRCKNRMQEDRCRRMQDRANAGGCRMQENKKVSGMQQSAGKFNKIIFSVFGVFWQVQGHMQVWQEAK